MIEAIRPSETSVDSQRIRRRYIQKTEQFVTTSVKTSNPPPWKKKKLIVNRVEITSCCVIWGKHPYCWALTITKGPSDLNLRTRTHAARLTSTWRPAPNCRREPADNTASTLQVNSRPTNHLALHHWSHSDYAFACSLRMLLQEFNCWGWVKSEWLINKRTGNHAINITTKGWIDR